MCGIAGILSKRGLEPGHLQKMSEVIRHRGPDDEGYLLVGTNEEQVICRGEDTIKELSGLQHIDSIGREKSQSIGMIHRRLSILDLASTGHQPMFYKDDQLAIVYNGEVYNYKEIRDELKSKGHRFITNSDTEVILAAYAEWGETCVERFVGMWAFAMYDKRKKIFFLSRDRFGVKPLYYFFDADFFAFASEIKALLAIEGVESYCKKESLVEYLVFGTTSDPEDCLYEKIIQLPPGHNLIVEVESLRINIKSYYNIGDHIQDQGIEEENILSRYEELLANSVKLHMRSDVPVGGCLSGGLDSSAITAEVAASYPETIFKTFTAAYKDETDESDYARLVSDQYKNTSAHYTYPSSKDFWKDIDRLAWHQDLPYNSSSIFAQWEVMKLAGSNGIKVLLDGQGADESLGGYYNFAGIHLVELLKQGSILKFINEAGALKKNFTPNLVPVLGKAAFYFLPELFQKSIRSQNRLSVNFLSKEGLDIAKNIKVPERGGKTFRQHSVLSFQFGLQDLLRYEDRNSMAFSVESRVPYLDHRLVEFSIALGNDWKIKNGWTKYILRKTLEPKVDKRITWRKGKKGFLTPQKLWKEELRRELQEYLNNASYPDIINKEFVRNLCSTQLTKAAHLSEFWKIVSFLKWFEVFKIKIR